MRKKPTKRLNMLSIMSNPRYRGKHVILVKNKVFTAETGKKAGKILEEIHKKYPEESPQITYIPEADTLILWL
ncbi:hypothetical protein A3A52_01075 [Candidatus Woesebacteria bacterium RIFCSPLOWO2_01_FULL_39_14]|uniref:DUF5678 domain-containing protein n=1 Tax=Candidatus Woesebacteria bacterium RIFCSPLOWO2_01_FULL_39_14 TaxID=1802518 RepID=A0A1F8BBK2_9BACT|nr:MAG: hypothetical protein US72_C0017G0010 [Microgenomates group bacterium GW2011_GWC1_38_12]OGM61411.1 MAG: hypothetical protein A3A52_01075 [Candidatus Woesebacteria bacterium RIFCSPLOWO2_01_FULL_39_14]